MVTAFFWTIYRPAINYSTDFETDDPTWQAAGFARIENTVPQTFRLALITHATGGRPYRSSCRS